MKPDVEPTIEDLRKQIQELIKENAELKKELAEEKNERRKNFNGMCEAQSLNDRYLSIIEALAKPIK
jgi:regulator of replication initiation timing